MRAPGRPYVYLCRMTVVLSSVDRKENRRGKGRGGEKMGGQTYCSFRRFVEVMKDGQAWRLSIYKKLAERELFMKSFICAHTYVPHYHNNYSRSERFSRAACCCYFLLKIESVNN